MFQLLWNRAGRLGRLRHELELQTQKHEFSHAREISIEFNRLSSKRTFLKLQLMTQTINSASRKKNESESWSLCESDGSKCYKIACSPHRKWLICPQVKDHWLRRGENRGGWTSWSPNPFLERSDRLAVIPSLWFPRAWHSELRIWIWLALPICCTIPEAGRGRDSPCFPRRGLSGWPSGTWLIGRECHCFAQGNSCDRLTI